MAHPSGKYIQLRAALANRPAFTTRELQQLAETYCPSAYPAQLYQMVLRQWEKGLLKQDGKVGGRFRYVPTPEARRQWRKEAKEWYELHCPGIKPKCLASPKEEAIPAETSELRELHASGAGRLTIVRGLPGSGVSSHAAELARQRRAVYLDQMHFWTRGGRPRMECIALPWEDFLAAVRLFGDRGIDLVVGIYQMDKPTHQSICAAFYYKYGGSVETITLNRSPEECAKANRQGLDLAGVELRAGMWDDIPGETVVITGQPYAPGLAKEG